MLKKMVESIQKLLNSVLKQFYYIYILFLPVPIRKKNSGLKIKKPCIGPAGYFSVRMLLVLKSIRAPAKVAITYYTRSTRVLHISLTISLSLYGVDRTNIPPKIMFFLIPGICKYYTLCRKEGMANVIKVMIWRLFWIIYANPI